MVLITVLTLPIHILQTASLIMKKQKKNTKTPRPSVMQPDTPRDSFVESDTKLIEFL